MDKLLWIIVIFVFIILVFSLFNKFRVKYNTNDLLNEGFTTIRFCPFNSKEFIDKKGSSLCCDGKVEDNICYSKIICTLSTPIDGTPSCSNVYNKYINNEQKNKCPRGWNYYENNKEKGCVKGAVKEDRSSPINLNSNKCNIYNSLELNNKNKNSCKNINELSTFKCLKSDCTKYVDNDGLLYQSYKNNNITKICADNTRAKEVLLEKSEKAYNELKEANQIC
jgi:hypothetical protein